ncbi:TPA: hypothetical protein ACURK6_000967 [Escherichia coli]|nr:hypothetical protein [Escherichia coli]HCQ6783289.1 hypothetical protein [Escherichia coli]HDX2687343.1 hypothetical protein [Escherichia coli]HDZ9962333.1 hypothetical protein [Escherichia coli]HEA0800291.1 hypothetical protein [Escherichia coli]
MAKVCKYVMWWDGIAWQDLVSGPAGVGEITESNLLILLLNASGACR